MSTTKRLYFLDNLRVAAILIVFCFHCMRFFDGDDWHIKNAVVSPTASFIVNFLVLWIMPLFFFISGASTWYAIQKKSSGRFLLDRVKRIFVPLAFGCVVLALPQVYLERITHHQYAGSLLSFVPHYFEGWYAFGGNFAWMGLHLWYLLLLFVFSVVLLPLFIIGKRKLKGSRTHHLLAHPASLLLFPFISSIPGWLFHPDHLAGSRVWGGWNLFEHMLFFGLGFVAFSSPAFMEHCKKMKWPVLILALISSACYLTWYLKGMSAHFGTSFFIVKNLVRNTACWSWILSAMGFWSQYMNKTSKRLSYGSEAVLPFYILHQTVILIIGYFIVSSKLPVLFKYLIIAFVSFIIISILYEGVVRRFAFTRWLFGMPPSHPGKQKPVHPPKSVIHPL